MPLPLILAVPALVAVAGAGAKKAVDGVSKAREAKKVDRDARNKLAHWQGRHNGAMRHCDDALEELGRARAVAFERSLPKFIGVVSRLRNAEVVAEAFNDELPVDEIKAGPLRDVALKQIELLGSASAGVIGGAVAGQATTAAVATFGAASTGTAIGSLSGAAATNATLAWLGGGSLAAGGAGIAGGAMVLGGIAVAPALLVGGLLLDKQMEKKLSQAEANAEEVAAAVAKIKVANLRLASVKDAAVAGAQRIRHLSRTLSLHTNKLSDQADANPDVADWDRERIDELRGTANLAAILVGLASAPLLAGDGGIDPDFQKALERD